MAAIRVTRHAPHVTSLLSDLKDDAIISRDFLRGDYTMPDLGGLTAILQLIAAFFGAYLLAVWIGLIIWTFRDVRERSRDIFVQLLSVALVVIFFIPGLLLYFLLRPGEKMAERYERELSEEALLQDIEEKQACPACQQKV
ncbi:MAG: hypothetical protein KGJ80_17115, partial [Chloroflexota bacterium]|nr:hypothetical protein [Chloroflexota bacterium]